MAQNVATLDQASSAQAKFYPNGPDRLRCDENRPSLSPCKRLWAQYVAIVSVLHGLVILGLSAGLPHDASLAIGEKQVVVEVAHLPDDRQSATFNNGQPAVPAVTPTSQPTMPDKTTLPVEPAPARPLPDTDAHQATPVDAQQPTGYQATNAPEPGQKPDTPPDGQVRMPPHLPDPAQTTAATSAAAAALSVSLSGMADATAATPALPSAISLPASSVDPPLPKQRVPVVPRPRALALASTRHAAAGKVGTPSHEMAMLGPFQDAQHALSRSPAQSSNPGIATQSTSQITSSATLFGEIRQAVQQAVRCPAAARMMEQSGQSSIAFDYRNGQLVGAPRLKHSSGVPSLDNAAMDAVRQARYPAASSDDAAGILHLMVQVEEDCDG